jgi:hypothetical protein
MDARQTTTEAPLHWDPSAVPRCMQKPSPEQIQYRGVADRVHLRVRRAQTLDCKVLDERNGRYHVTGGEDPEGHTVDLTADWGLQCTCGSHMMAHAYCKHLMRVGLERGLSFADMKDENGILQPGMFKKAVEKDLENAARRTERDA